MGKKIYRDFSGLGGLPGRDMADKSKVTGEIKWFDKEKGFGKFQKSDDGEEVFLHYSVLPRGLKKSDIDEGDVFQYNIEQTHRRPKAVNVEFVKKSQLTLQNQALRQTVSPNNNQHIAYRLPADTQKAINHLGRDNIDNFYLKLHKTPHYNDKDGFTFFRKENEKNQYPAGFGDFNFEKANERLKRAAEMVTDQLQCFTLPVDWRMAVGLGSESVYETSMTLHHIYGIPYIPGQAIKGALRNNVLNAVFGVHSGEFDLQGAENRALQNDSFINIFGSQKKAGHIIFFDAFPKTTPKIKPDVMTVHYSDYYGSGKPPADYSNPTPIPFLTVEDTLFAFIIGIKKQHKNEQVQLGERSGTILEVAAGWLKETLVLHGIGAKTAVGYGYFGNEIL